MRSTRKLFALLSHNFCIVNLKLLRSKVLRKPSPSLLWSSISWRLVQCELLAHFLFTPPWTFHCSWFICAPSLLNFIAVLNYPARYGSACTLQGLLKLVKTLELTGSKVHHTELIIQSTCTVLIEWIGMKVPSPILKCWSEEQSTLKVIVSPKYIYRKVCKELTDSANF